MDMYEDFLCRLIRLIEQSDKLDSVFGIDTLQGGFHPLNLAHQALFDMTEPDYTKISSYGIVPNGTTATNERHFLKTSTLSILSALLLLAAPRAQAIGITLITNQANVAWVTNETAGIDENFGNFSITLKLTADDRDLFVKKDPNPFDAFIHGTTLRIDGIAAPIFEKRREFMVSSPGSVAGDNSGWYSIPQGESRNFQFLLSLVAPHQTGWYSWELVSIEISDAPGGGSDEQLDLFGPMFETSQIYMIQIVPEPSSAVLLLAGAAFMLRRRR